MQKVKRSNRKEHRRSESYHHGDLRAALVRAADEILADQGVEGFSLREAARRAGVSPAAPAHHFGSAAGLLSEVAVLGFEELNKYLAVDTAMTPTQRLWMQGIGYVRFALTYPGRFHLMFRRDLLSQDHAALLEAGERTLAQLEHTIRAIRSLADDQALDAETRIAVLAAWSMVHGFAHLALDGKLASMHAGTRLDGLLETVLPEMLRSQWPDS